MTITFLVPWPGIYVNPPDFRFLFLIKMVFPTSRNYITWMARLTALVEKDFQKRCLLKVGPKWKISKTPRRPFLLTFLSWFFNRVPPMINEVPHVAIELALTLMTLMWTSVLFFFQKTHPLLLDFTKVGLNTWLSSSSMKVFFLTMWVSYVNFTASFQSIQSQILAWVILF